MAISRKFFFKIKKKMIWILVREKIKIYMVLIYTIICSENCMNRGLGSLIERKNIRQMYRNSLNLTGTGVRSLYVRIKINVILVLQTKALPSFDNISLLQLIISFVLLSTIIDFFSAWYKTEIRRVDTVPVPNHYHWTDLFAWVCGAH